MGKVGCLQQQCGEVRRSQTSQPSTVHSAPRSVAATRMGLWSEDSKSKEASSSPSWLERPDVSALGGSISARPSSPGPAPWGLTLLCCFGQKGGPEGSPPAARGPRAAQNKLSVGKQGTMGKKKKDKEKGFLAQSSSEGRTLPESLNEDLWDAAGKRWTEI